MNALRLALPGMLAGLVIGCVVAAGLCAMALDHNPQGEFANDATGTYTHELYRLFVWSALTIGAPVAAAVWLGTAFAWWIARRSD